MKKVLLAISMIASLMAVSCKKEETPSVSEEPEVYEVKIGINDAIKSEMIPLTKSDGDERLIGVQVLSCPEGGKDSDYMYYAFGLFRNDDITVRLLSGYKYKFEVRSMPYSETAVGICWPYNSTHPTSYYMTNEFNYTTSMWLKREIGFRPTDLFFGVVTNYTPVKDGSISVNLERVSFALSVSVENLENGFVTVKATSANFSGTLDFRFDENEMSHYSYYTLDDIYYTSNTLKFVAEWTTQDNVTIPLGMADVKVMRNTLSKVVINASNPSSKSAFSLSYSDNPLIESEDNTYTIGGEDSDDTTITTGN